jgi:hypothetical protein
MTPMTLAEAKQTLSGIVDAAMARGLFNKLADMPILVDALNAFDRAQEKIDNLTYLVNNPQPADLATKKISDGLPK